VNWCFGAGQTKNRLTCAAARAGGALRPALVLGGGGKKLAEAGSAGSPSFKAGLISEPVQLGSFAGWRRSAFLALLTRVPAADEECRTTSASGRCGRQPPPGRPGGVGGFLSGNCALVEGFALVAALRGAAGPVLPFYAAGQWQPACLADSSTNSPGGPSKVLWALGRRQPCRLVLPAAAGRWRRVGQLAGPRRLNDAQAAARSRPADRLGLPSGMGGLFGRTASGPNVPRPNQLPFCSLSWVACMAHAV